MSERLPSALSTVLFCALPDGAVLFSSEQEIYYGLNETGVIVWQNLAPVCTTVDDVCTVLKARFPEVEEDVLRADVVALLSHLVESGLATHQ